MTEDFKRKLSAILSADVVGYSRLMGDNESATVKTLETYKGVMSSLIKQHRGRVVDSPGDNLLAEFGSVVDAVQCAVSIQKELQTRNTDLPENRRMEFRIGINLGDVIEEEDRIYGDGVNIAARLEALADPGGICISKTAFDYIENKLPFGYSFIGEQTVKNIDKPVGAYKVLMETRLIDEEEKNAKAPFWRRKAAFSLGIIVVLAVITGLYWNFYISRQPAETTSVTPAQETIVSDIKESPKTIAVLPFENLSSEKDQEYFSDGLADALITKLSQVKDLEVTARTSSFYFKGKNEDMRTIGEKLGVSYLLEGSVQKSENKLRIIAQLIKASDGYHLWSETYDSELEDIFAIQDDIAKAVTTALSITLGVGKFNQPGMTRNIEAYDEYLQGISNLSIYTPDSMLRAVDNAERAVLFDPDFVRGWLLLASIYKVGIGLLPPKQTINFEEKAEEAFERARAIEPDMPGVLASTAQKHRSVGNWLEADRIYKQLLEKYGLTSATQNQEYGAMLLGAGRVSDALPFLQRAKRLAPLSSAISLQLSLALFDLNRMEEALAEVRRGKTLEGFNYPFSAMEEIISLLSGDNFERRIFGDDEAMLTQIKTIMNNPNATRHDTTEAMNFAVLRGDPKLALELYNKSKSSNPSIFWGPHFSDMRQLPDFKGIVRDLGLVDYWRKTGNWGDFCRPIGDDDFECD